MGDSLDLANSIGTEIAEGENFNEIFYDDAGHGTVRGSSRLRARTHSSTAKTSLLALVGLAPPTIYPIEWTPSWFIPVTDTYDNDHVDDHYDNDNHYDDFNDHNIACDPSPTNGSLWI